MEQDKHTPENSQPTPVEKLKKHVDQLFNNQEAINAGEVKRYVGGDKGQVVTVSLDSESKDYTIDYNGNAGPAGTFAERYAVHETARLTHDGKLINLSERSEREEDMRPDYDYEKTFAPLLLDTLEYTTIRPRRTLGRMAFALLNRNK